MKNKFYILPRNEKVQIEICLPVYRYIVRYTVSGIPQSKERYAYNCIVNNEKKIISLPKSVAKKNRMHKRRKSLK